MRYRVRVDKMGRITIPKGIRERMGIKEGESILELELGDGEVIVIRLLVR